MDDLLSYEPIAIWSIPVQYKSPAEPRTATWNCGQNGLTRFNHAFDPNVAQFIPLAEPARTQKGTIKVHQPRFVKKPLDYWKAQCEFRGLSPAGKIGELQSRVRAAPSTVIAEDIQELELEIKSLREFRVKNAKARDEEDARREAIYKKQTADTKDFLEREFPPDKDDKQKVIVVDAEDRFELWEGASNLNLFCSFWETSIVGRTRALVDEKLLAFKKEDKRKMQEIERKRKRDEAQEEQAAKDLFVAKRQKVLEAAGKNWDVIGTWQILYPEVEDQYSRSITEECMTMEIYWEQTSKGPQMFTEFDFSVISDVMRFESQKIKKKTAPAKGGPNKIPAKGGSNKIQAKASSDEELEKESEEDFYGERRSPTPEAFYLKSSVTKPSAKKPYMDLSMAR